MVNVPQFTMGANILPSFMQGAQGVSNALAQWQGRNQQAQQMAQQAQQFQATNALAQAQLGIQKSRFQMEQEAAQRQREQAEKTRAFLSNPANLAGIPAPLAGLVGVTNDPTAVQNFYLEQAKAQAKNRLAQSGPEGYGKAGAVFQDPVTGEFKAIQFGDRGTLKTHSLGGIEPARGVTQVGDELIAGGSGRTVRNVGDQIRGEQIAKGEGQDLAKTRAELPEAKLRLDLMTSQLDRLKQSALSVEGQAGLNRIVGGRVQAWTPDLSTPAVDAATELDNLKVKISGQVLQTMREMSKSGGAVGQVTEREWPRLENMLANLDRSQSLPQFKRNLKSVVRYVDDLNKMLSDAYRADVAKARRAQQLGGSNRGQYTRVAPQSAPVSSIPPPPQPAQAAAAARPVHPQAVQMLQANPTPETRAQFDEIFGAGAADRVLGGQ